MSHPSSRLKRVVSVFTLTMINVAAIGNIENWSVAAEFGLASIFYLLLATIAFFIPISLVSAELATGWPLSGGVFAWVKQAFGHRIGFLAIWLLWIHNLFWYPTILSIIAASIAYIFNPELSNNTHYTAAIIFTVFWGATIANLKGMKTAGRISSIGVLLGMLIPGAVIIMLGAIWYSSGKPMQISFSLNAIIPNMGSIKELVFFTGILLSLCGMEMSGVHAKDVKDPERDYPRAIFFSALIIISCFVLGVLAIASVVPQKQISLVSGPLQAFDYITKAFHIEWITPWFAGLMTIGFIGALSTWILGPSKGLIAAAQHGDLPPFFRRINGQGIPKHLLLAQGIIVSFISLIFIWMPTVSSGFWILSAVTAQLYLMMYLLIFASVIKLRYKMPNHVRPYRIPGGKIGVWATALLGMSSSVFAIIIGFFPPAQIETGKEFSYIAFILTCTALVCLGPSLILKFQKPSWKIRLKHENEKF